MKNKRQKMQILTQDLVKYCQQIGIPETEIPKIVWDKRTFKKLSGGYKLRKSVAGTWSYTHNTILVDLEEKGSYVYRTVYRGKKHTAWWHRVRNDLNSVRNTLVHELVHMRWQHKCHGWKFEKLMKDIINGATFPMRTDKDKLDYFNKHNTPSLTNN
jgi:hypothetical protein